MALELDTLQNNLKCCWEVVSYPTDGHHNYLRCHFVYNKARMKQGKVDIKSRLVVDGSKQVHGLDYSESFPCCEIHYSSNISCHICCI
jgi:hypothetical protein